MLKTIIKASRITNLTDARYFSAWEVAYLGFNLEEGTEGYTQPKDARTIMEWLEGPKYIAELGAFPDVPEVAAWLKDTDWHGVQLPTLCPVATVQAFHALSIPVIKEIVWNETSHWSHIQAEYARLAPYVECFLLDFSQNQVDLPTHLPHVQAITQLHPTLLDFPMGGILASEWLEKLKPLGFAIKGGEEEKVGYKSFDELDGIFESLEIFV